MSLTSRCATISCSNSPVVQCMYRCIGPMSYRLGFSKPDERAADAGHKMAYLVTYRPTWEAIMLCATVIVDALSWPFSNDCSETD